MSADAEIPRELTIMAEMSWLLWQARELDKARAQRSGMDRLVDDATGRVEAENAELEAQMKALADELKELRQ